MDAVYTGNKIAQRRKEKGWTQRDIAERLHISVAAVSKWERGLNYPDLSLMEPLGALLDITVAELLGLENEPAERIIQNITEISAQEKQASQKCLWAKVAATAAVFMAVCYLVYQFMMSGVRFFQVSWLNLLALVLGGAAWCLAIMGIFSRKEGHWLWYSLASLTCCAAALHIPTLVTYLTVRFEYAATVGDVAGADYFGSAVLLAGTVLFNVCAALVHRRKWGK